jgi:hypothetical protein
MKSDHVNPGRPIKVFISYRRSESLGVARLTHSILIEHGASVFLDERSIPSGSNFQEEIQQALSQCDAVIAIFEKRQPLFKKHLISSAKDLFLRILSASRIIKNSGRSQQLDWMSIELSEALRQEKEILPLVHDSIPDNNLLRLRTNVAKQIHSLNRTKYPDDEKYKLDAVILLVQNLLERRRSLTTRQEERQGEWISCIPGNMSDTSIVGRTRELHKIRQTIAFDNRSLVLFLDRGVGKSTLAASVAVDQYFLQNSGFAGVLWISFPAVPISRDEFSGADIATESRLSASREIDYRVLNEKIEEWAEVIATKNSIARYRSARSLLREEFSKRKYLLIFDDPNHVDIIAEINDLVDLRVSRAIVTTNVDEIVKRAKSQNFIPINIKNFAHSEAIEYLNHRCQEKGCLKGLELINDIDEIIEHVDGSPIVLEIISGIVARHYEEKNYKQLESLYEKILKDEYIEEKVVKFLPANLSTDRQPTSLGFISLEKLFVYSTSGLPIEIRATLYQLGCLRPRPYLFSRSEASATCAARDSHLETLTKQGFIRFHHDKFSIHSLIARLAFKELTRAQKNDVAAVCLDTSTIHERGMSYHGKLMTDIVATKGDSYSIHWKHFENAEWRDARRAWLYHFSALGNSTGSMIHFLTTWFESFWWWGFFEQFRFCDELIYDAKLLLHPMDDRRLGLTYLIGFHQAYSRVRGREKRGEPFEWLIVKKSLLSLAEWINAAQQRNTASKSSSRLSIFMRFFEAEVLAYGENNPIAADTLVQESLRELRSAYDDSSAAHIDTLTESYLTYYSIYFSSLSNERDILAKCQSRIRIALLEMESNKDISELQPELLSNFHQLAAEVSLNLNDQSSATAHIGRTIFYAYLMQSSPETADDYSLKYLSFRIAKIFLTLQRATKIESIHATIPILMKQDLLNFIRRLHAKIILNSTISDAFEEDNDYFFLKDGAIEQTGLPKSLQEGLDQGIGHTMNEVSEAISLIVEAELSGLWYKFCKPYLLISTPILKEALDFKADTSKIDGTGIIE